MQWTSEAVVTLAIGILGLISSTAILVWFVSSQFSGNRNLMWKALTELGDKIIKKLEYHERHDDERFSQMAETVNTRTRELSDRIWTIEIRNAAKDGTLPTEYKKN